MLKKMNLLYRFEKLIFSFLGDIKVFGWKHPLWIKINAHGYKLKGSNYRHLKKLIQPGDICIRRFDGYLSSYMIPGFWNHAGLYIGDDGENKEQIVHAVSEGVIQEDILNFMRTDYMLVLRIASDKSGKLVKDAIQSAKSIVGSPYDFGFDFTDTHRFSCTELVDFCYPKMVKGKKRFGKKVIIADDFSNCSHFTKIWDSRFKNIQQMSIVKNFMFKQRSLRNELFLNKPPKRKI